MISVLVVHEAHRKVSAIAEVLAELRILDNARLKTLYDACKTKVKPSTFKSALYAGRLTRTMCDELSRLCNLVDEGDINLVQDETFIDLSTAQVVRESSTYPDYPGRDAPKNFIKKLRQRYGLGPNIQVKAIQSNPILLEENLLNFEIDDSGQSTPLGESIPIFFSAVGGIIRDISGVTFGVNNIRIQIRVDDSSETRISERLDGVRLKDARLTSEGLSKSANWSLKAKSGSSLVGEYVTSDGPFCSLSEVRLGTVVVATAATNILEPGSIVVTTPGNVQDTTREIVKRMMEKSISGNTDSGGWKTLARQTLRISKS